MTSSNHHEDPSQRRRERRNRRKERSASTLEGMFQAESVTQPRTHALAVPRQSTGEEEHIATGEDRTSTSTPRAASPSSVDKYSEAERLELQEMTRKLRQAKRRLFLKSAARPTDSVTQLRQILLQISFDESLSAMSTTSSSSLASSPATSTRQLMVSPLQEEEGEASHQQRMLEPHKEAVESLG